MGDVIGPELGFEPVFSLALRSRHYAGVGDENVERLALAQEVFHSFLHGLQTLEIHLNERDFAAFGLAFDFVDGFLTCSFSKSD